MNATKPVEKINTSITTPEFRISYPHVFKAVKNNLNGDMEYDLIALFAPGANLEGMKAAAQNACLREWGPDRTKWPAINRNPFRDQAEKMKNGALPDGYVAGAIYMSFRCKADKHKPIIVDQNRQAIIEESKFYPGGWAKANVNAYAFAKGTNYGVAFGLNMLQFVRDDTPFSGRPTIEQAFEPIVSAEIGGAPGDATSLF